VELSDSKCEGMVPTRQLTDDFYIFDEKNYWLIGERTHKTFQLGEEVVVKVAKTDLAKKQLDFDLVGKKDEVNLDEIKKQEESDIDGHAEQN
jgi:ribonuclease R